MWILLVYCTACNALPYVHYMTSNVHCAIELQRSKLPVDGLQGECVFYRGRR
jgi:hypothetical protein